MTAPAVTERRLSAVAPVFTALGDATRLRLLTRLCEEGPLSITRLAAAAPISRQAVTKHLHVLSRAGLARSVRHGRERQWRVDERRLDEVKRLLDQISARWDESLVRLKRMVEDGRR
jgi:DNA-binding transcriptional ArsR family regulator